MHGWRGDSAFWHDGPWDLWQQMPMGSNMLGLRQSCACAKTKDVVFKSDRCGFKLTSPFSSHVCFLLWTTVSCHWEMKRCPLCSFISQPLPRTWYGMRNPVSSSVYFLSCSFSYFRWTPRNIYYIPYSALPLYVWKLGNYVHPAQRAALPFNIYCIPTKFLDRWRIRLKSMEAKKS